MVFQALKVGELAQRTRLTVRALHHYDEIGLLKPSLHEEMSMLENYYTADQLEYLKKRREQISEERMQQVPGEWARLIAEVRAAMENGTDPLAPEVQAMARRWIALVNEFTGGDPGIERSVGRLWQEQGDTIVARHGSEYDSRGLHDYIGKAIAAVRSAG